MKLEFRLASGVEVGATVLSQLHDALSQLVANDAGIPLVEAATLALDCAVVKPRSGGGGGGGAGRRVRRLGEGRASSVSMGVSPSVGVSASLSVSVSSGQARRRLASSASSSSASAVAANDPPSGANTINGTNGTQTNGTNAPTPAAAPGGGGRGGSGGDDNVLVVRVSINVVAQDAGNLQKSLERIVKKKAGGGLSPLMESLGLNEEAKGTFAEGKDVGEATRAAVAMGDASEDSTTIPNDEEGEERQGDGGGEMRGERGGETDTMAVT